jgi:murein DD-endopeptidase MepM/ murein hydrolase activator NlpD
LNIFLVSSDTSRPVRAIVFGWKKLFLSLATGIVLFLVCAFALNYVIIRWAAATNHPWLQAMVLADQRAANAKAEEKVQAQLDTMALRLGELQAKLSQVEDSSERVSKAVGLTSKKEVPEAGEGGLEVMPRSFTTSELNDMIDDLTTRLTDQSNQLDVLDTLVTQNAANKNFFPSHLPLKTKWWLSSHFGYRIDPFTGHKSFHEGLDFAAMRGTPILAAASGKVTRAGVYSGYGRMVEINHGNGLLTRYGHMSEVLVNPGDVVVQGQVIGAVGSTGRSTGPHLHFEVRLNGVAQNPMRFLAYFHNGKLLGPAVSPLHRRG